MAKAPHRGQFDLLVAADLVGELREFEQLAVARRSQRCDCLLNERTILTDQGTFHPAYLGVPKGIKRCPTQPTHTAEELKRRVEPTPKANLLLPAQGPQEGWMELVGNPRIRTKLFG